MYLSYGTKTKTVLLSTPYFEKLKEKFYKTIFYLPNEAKVLKSKHKHPDMDFLTEIVKNWQTFDLNQEL